MDISIGLNKLTFILKVLRSCETSEQVTTTYNWGYKVINNYLPKFNDKYGIVEFYYILNTNRLCISILLERVDKKRIELSEK